MSACARVSRAQMYETILAQMKTREIRRVLRRDVEAELAEKLIAHGSRRGTRVEVCVRRGKLHFAL